MDIDLRVDAPLTAVQERVYVAVSMLFIGTLAIVNVIGLTKFIDLSFRIPLTSIPIPLVVPVGVLAYPVTFLCTDILSEFFGRRRTNRVVWLGLIVNLWVVAVLALGSVLPAVSAEQQDGLFSEIQQRALGAVTASMGAYLLAQFLDVELFHFWKRITSGKHLWLRNNASTLVSQLIDSIAVVLITYALTDALPLDSKGELVPQLASLVFSSYLFKAISALADTLPFYFSVWALKKHLNKLQ